MVTVRPMNKPPTFGARLSTAVPNTTRTKKNVAIASAMIPWIIVVEVAECRGSSTDDLIGVPV